MAQADIRKANILAYLHLRVVRRVLRRLLDHGVTREKPSLRIDHYLFHHMSKINQHPIGIQNQNHLFPGFGVNANVDDWPVYLFPFLIDITGQGWLHEDLRDSVRQISQARMELYSKIVIGISKEYFEQQVKIVQTAVQRICQCISDMQFTDEINDEIRNVEEMREPRDNADFVEAYNINHHTEKSYRQRVMEFTENQQRLHDFITQNAGNYEAQDEELEDLSIRDQDHTRDLEQAHQQGHDITSRSLPPRSASGKYPINMPELTVEIDISGCNSAELHQVADRIVNSFNNRGEHSLDPANTCIKNTLDNTFMSYGGKALFDDCIETCTPVTINSYYNVKISLLSF
ncbi:uncharacterized protein LOC127880585 [Dreissena polymorpha]|uniref:uncharacterized protein LOC127880585 n=1 Tax=Dreissena polymorpha TaxID=45954 RepID=UPI002263CED1|nr:uncharacterized protein LOC127880585 [Dreissena polymorpha]